MTDMTISRRGFAAGLAAALALPAPLLARAADATARNFVEQIYGSYVGTAGQKGIPLEDAATIRRYFTPGLASLILDDQAAAKKRGEPPTLDGDAFVGHQEWDIAGLNVDAKEAAKDEPGVFSKLTAFFGHTGPSPVNKYRISIKAPGDTATVTVLNDQGQPDNSENAQRIVTLLVDELK